MFSQSSVVLIICPLSVITVSLSCSLGASVSSHQKFKHRDERMKSATFIKREPVHTNTMRRERFFYTWCVCQLSAAASPQTFMLPFTHASSFCVVSFTWISSHRNIHHLHMNLLSVSELTQAKTVYNQSFCTLQLFPKLLVFTRCVDV